MLVVGFRGCVTFLDKPVEAVHIPSVSNLLPGQGENHLSRENDQTQSSAKTIKQDTESGNVM